VVIASDTAYTPFGPDGEELTGHARAEAMEAGLVATLRRLHDRGLGTVVITDTPAAPDEVPACVSEHLHDFQSCAFRERRGWNLEFERRAAARSPGAHLIDLTAEICPHHLCRAVIGNALTYRDDSHLTATFARTLSPWIERGLEAAGLP
jgi:hypothetical protein